MRAGSRHVAPRQRIAAPPSAVPQAAVGVALPRRRARGRPRPAPLPCTRHTLTRASGAQHGVHVVQDQSEPPHLQAVPLDPGGETLAGQAAARVVRHTQRDAGSLREERHRAQSGLSQGSVSRCAYIQLNTANVDAEQSQYSCVHSSRESASHMWVNHQAAAHSNKTQAALTAGRIRSSHERHPGTVGDGQGRTPVMAHAGRLVFCLRAMMGSDAVWWGHQAVRAV